MSSHNGGTADMAIAETIEDTRPEKLCEVTELGIDADQAASGIVDAIEVRWGRMTLVLAETDDGCMLFGSSTVAPWVVPNPYRARATCWERLLGSLPKVRAAMFRKAGA